MKVKLMSTALLFAAVIASEDSSAQNLQNVSAMNADDSSSFYETYVNLSNLAAEGNAVFQVNVQSIGGLEGDIGFAIFSYVCGNVAGGSVTVTKPATCASCYPYGGVGPGARVPTPSQVWSSCASCVMAFPAGTANRSILAVCGAFPGRNGDCPFPGDPAC